MWEQARSHTGFAQSLDYWVYELIAERGITG